METPLTPMALYIHWPFCVSKCPYCDFNSHVRDGVDVEAWRTALKADMAYEAAQLPGRTLGSIFFGGGTPSLMPPALVAELISCAKTHWMPARDLEITLEANPSSVEAANFSALADAGVNRVSLGIQSFNDETLAFLGRAHSSQEAREAISIAQNAFKRVNIDFIYALPDQTAPQWREELSEILSIGTDHLSLYQLTIEPGTRFARLVEDGRLRPMPPDDAAELYEITSEMTQSAGFGHYETSNYAKPGQQSRHNLTYWRYGDYAGIGPGAHGRRGGLATQRHKKPENWLAAVERNGHGIQEEIALTPQESAREALVMGLRLEDGIDLAQLGARFGFTADQLVHRAKADLLAAQGLVRREGTQLATTQQGKLLLDAILTEIVAI